MSFVVSVFAPASSEKNRRWKEASPETETDSGLVVWMIGLQSIAPVQTRILSLEHPNSPGEAP